MDARWAEQLAFTTFIYPQFQGRVVLAPTPEANGYPALHGNPFPSSQGAVLSHWWARGERRLGGMAGPWVDRCWEGKAQGSSAVGGSRQG